jgi:hypothetical protein
VDGGVHVPKTSIPFLRRTQNDRAGTRQPGRVRTRTWTQSRSFLQALPSLPPADRSLASVTPLSCVEWIPSAAGRRMPCCLTRLAPSSANPIPESPVSSFPLTTPGGPAAPLTPFLAPVFRVALLLRWPLCLASALCPRCPRYLSHGS